MGANSILANRNLWELKVSEDKKPKQKEIVKRNEGSREKPDRIIKDSGRHTATNSDPLKGSGKETKRTKG